ncbi:MAG: sodium:solute symporter family protein [Bacteroidota bacterium]
MDIIYQQISGTQLSYLDLALLIVYTLVCIGIGLWNSRKQADADFLIAGRSLNLWGFVTSVVASYIGGAAIVAYAAYVYNFGISAIAVFVGTSLGFMIFIPYAKKLRKIGASQKFYTLSDWFYHKYGNGPGAVSAAILLFVYFGMLLNQFIAGSSILANISGLSYEVSLLLSSIIITVYLVAGGFNSVIKTDIFQYIVLFVLFIILAVILTGQQTNLILDMADFSDMSIGMTIAFVAFGIFIIFQSAEYWQRVYAAKSDNVVSRGLMSAAFLTLITGFAITLIGLSAHHNSPGIEAKDAFAAGLGHLISGKYLGASLVLMFAAIMSSADTQIFVLASSVSVDWIQRFSPKKPGEHRLKLLTRLSIVFFSLLGLLCAWFMRDLVAVIIFITGVGFTIIPAAIASFHIKLSQLAVLISFVSGVIYVIGLAVFASLQPDSFEFFKDNADLAILSIAVSGVTLLITQMFIKYIKK